MRFLSRIRNSTLLVYFSALIVPILIIGIVYQNSARAASAKAESSFSTALMQVRNNVDSELTSSDRIFAQITLLQNIECMYTHNAQINEQQLFFLYKTIPQLRAFTAANNRIDSVYLYFPDKDFIVSGAGSFDKKTIDHWFSCATGLDKQKILQLAGRSDCASFVPVSLTDLNVSANPQRQAMIAYVRPIVPVKSQTPPVVVIVFMKQSEIMNAYSDLYTVSYGSVSAIASGGGFLFNPAPKYLQDKDYAYFAKRTDPQPSFLVKGTGGPYRVNSVASGVADWSYILSVPENVYAANINEVTNATLISILVYLIVVFFAAWYFYKKNYKPLHKLIDLIKKAGRGTKQPEYEFSYIEHSVMDILDDNQKINDILIKQKDSLKHGMLARLINGGSQNGSWDLSVSESGLCMDKSQNFIFLVYPIYPQGNQGGSRAAAFSPEAYTELAEGFRDVESIYILRSEDHFICVANTDTDISFVAARASQLCLTIARECAETAGFRYTLAFSGKHDCLDDLSKAYAEALEVKEYKTYLGMPDIILYEEMRAGFSASSPRIGDIETELQIINHIKSQEYEPAIELINEQMNGILRMKSLPLGLLKCRMFGVINLLLSIIGEMRSMYDFTFMKEVNAAEVLLECKSIHEMQVCMSDIFDQMRNYIQQKERDLDSSRMRAIMDFVKDNFNRPDMCIMYLSQVFSRNESYISRSFKRYVGMGFLDYLHTLRIVEAKRLLKEGMHIKDVAPMVGYTNDITLIRAFKRYEGMTPGKFKSGEPVKAAPEEKYGPQ